MYNQRWMTKEKILLLLEVNGECREWRMPWAENVLGVLIFSAAVTFWYLCAEQHSNGHSYVIKFGDVTPNDQGGRILGTMESIENLKHFQFRFWENCFERRMPWVEYAVSVESSHFHFAFSIQILGECRERRMPWVEYAVNVESSHFHFTCSVQILGECRERRMPWVKYAVSGECHFPTNPFLEMQFSWYLWWCCNAWHMRRICGVCHMPLLLLNSIDCEPVCCWLLVIVHKWW